MFIRASIEPLVWENQFFFTGKAHSAKLIFAATAPSISVEALQQYALLQAKVNSDQLAIVDQLMTLGFQLVESEVDCRFDTDAINSSVQVDTVRLAQVADLPFLLPIAKTVFQQSRFRSPWYAPMASSQFYGQWLENAITGSFDDECWIWQNPDLRQPQGFVTLRWLDAQCARIGLLAVAQQAQKQGIGQQLLMAALARCQQRGIKQLAVATQLSNVAALNLYLRYQAKISQTAYWLYRTNHDSV